MSRRCSCGWLWIVMLVCAAFVVVRSASAQVATYHMHREASGGGLLLTPAGPDASAVVVSSANFKNTPVGEHVVRVFEAASGVAPGGGVIPAHAAVAFTVWMSKSGNQAAMVPRAKVFLNSAAGTPLCVASGTSPLTTTLVAYSFGCVTTAPVTVAAPDRFVVWVGVDVTVDANGNYAAQLGVEGVAGGRSDSRVVVPLVLSPSRAAVGATVTIAGVNFGAAPGGQVSVNGVPGVPTAWSNTAISLPVPPGATSGPVVVSSGGSTSLGSPFVVVPAITGVTPQAGVPGTAVVVSGTSFGPVPGRVTFNGTAASVTGWADTRVVAVVPDGATTGPVVLEANGEAAAGGAFMVLAPPELSGLSPAEGAEGSVVTIDGAHFGERQAADGATVGGLGAAVVSWTDTRIVVTVPRGATTGHVLVTAHGLTSNGLVFTVRAPGVSILTPAAGSVLQAGLTPVTASVSGLPAGVVSARCNGAAGTIDGAVIACVVPVQKGRNAIVVVVVDAAGNEHSGSVGVSGVAPPTALLATPSRHTLVPGERRTVLVTDDSGRVVTDATWASEQPGIVGVDANGNIRALASGATEVVATAGGLTVRVPVEVLDGALPAGMTAWAIDPTPGWYQYATTATDAATAAFVTAEVQYGNGGVVSAMQLRAFDDDGLQSALVAVPVSPIVQTWRLMGDALGGVLVVATSTTARTITRLAVDPSDTVAWQHRVGGDLDASVAQGADGTIFTMTGRTAFNYVPVVREPLVVGIDGRTGQRRFAVAPIAPSYCASAGGYSELSRFDAPLTVDSEGVAHVLGIVRDQNGVTPESCGPTALADIYLAARVVHYRITPDGTTTATELYRHASEATYFTFRGRFFTVPDDRGGALAAWEWCAGAQGACRTLARHVDVGQLGAVFELPHQFGMGSMVSASGRTAYYGGSVTPAARFDMLTGGVSWSDGAPGLPLASRADGRVEVHRFGVGRVLVDPSASVATSAEPRVATPMVATAGRWRVTADLGDVSAVADDGFMPDVAAFAIAPGGAGHQGGGLQGRGAAAGPYGVFFKGHFIFVGDVPLGKHASLHLVPRDQAAWRQFRPDLFNDTQVDARGLAFATLGAGPGSNHVRELDSSHICPSGKALTGAWNFETDVHRQAVDYEPVRVAPASENALMLRLLTAAGNYRDQLPYCFDPHLAPAYYNSNSFVSGVLRGLDVPSPQAPRVPSRYLGWGKPVPRTEFLSQP